MLIYPQLIMEKRSTSVQLATTKDTLWILWLYLLYSLNFSTNLEVLEFYIFYIYDPSGGLEVTTCHNSSPVISQENKFRHKNSLQKGCNCFHMT